MKESKFIEQNKKNWLEFEAGLRTNQNKATRLSRLFIQVTDDLSYARTFYKYRSVKVYLNGIAQVLFNDLYRNQSGNLKEFVKFWKTDLPLQIHDTRQEFRISFILFLLAFSIGVLSSMYDKDFARTILGNEYVEMTNENIKNGDPLAVYKKGNEMQMFMGISINNMKVAMITFVLGVFLSIGTFVALIRNGVMVGVFQYFFVEKGLFKESFLTIWQHGTLEISCIIIAGAAGLTLGKGLLFPGTYSRMESFKASALRGLKIFVGIAPIIIVAAFIEGFFTRYTNIHIGVRLAVIILSLAFVLFYFVYYPWMISRKHAKTTLKTEKPSYRGDDAFSFSSILSPEELLGYTLRFVNRNVLWTLVLFMGIATFHAVAAVTYHITLQITEVSKMVHNFSLFFEIKSTNIHFFIGVVTLTLVQCLTFYKIATILDTKNPLKKRISLLIMSTLTASLVVLIPFYWGMFWGIAVLVLVCPILFLAVYQSWVENVFFVSVLVRTFSLLNLSWSKISWNSIKITGFLLILYFLLNTQMAWEYFESIYINFNYSANAAYLIELFLLTFIVMFIFTMFFVLQAATSAISYYSFCETDNAEDLKQRIEQFGDRHSMFGFEKERSL